MSLRRYRFRAKKFWKQCRYCKECHTNNRHKIFCIGVGTYKIICQKNDTAQFIYIPPSSGEPLMQNATLGYKFFEVPIVWNDQWISNLRSEE